MIGGDYFSAEELRRSVSAVLVVVGGILLMAIFGFIVVPGLRNANQPVVGPSVTAPQLEMGWLDPVEYPATKGYDIPAVDPETVMKPNPALAARGSQLYAASCVPCHGAEGRGDGPSAKGMNPPPRNFTVESGWKNGHSLTGLFKTLEEGLKGTSMASYANLSRKDRMALAHHIRTFGTFAHGPDEPTSTAALASSFASAGEKVPPRIPVSRAMSTLVSETPQFAALAAPAGTDTGAIVFRKVVVNGTRAAQTLAQAPSWRDSPSALASAVVTGTSNNGFAPAAGTLSTDDWQALHTTLRGLLPEKR